MLRTAFRGLSDTDLGAIYGALGDVYPVAHYVGNVGEPRHCALCGHEHPFGEHNRIQLPAADAATSLVSLELEPVALDRAP